MGRGPQARLPEEEEFRDTGCSVAPRCLECPLPRCRYDVIGGVRTMRNEVRDHEIERLYADGDDIDNIASAYGISSRTVFRVLKASRGRAT